MNSSKSSFHENSRSVVSHPHHRCFYSNFIAHFIHSMSTSGLPSRRKYICNCMQHCRGEPREVSQNTWYRHAPYRSALPPIPANLIAAHHGTPFPPQTTTLANLASGSSNEDDVPFQPHKRRRLAVDTVLVSMSMSLPGDDLIFEYSRTAMWKVVGAIWMWEELRK